jgi:hypothetical protein
MRTRKKLKKNHPRLLSTIEKGGKKQNIQCVFTGWWTEEKMAATAAGGGWAHRLIQVHQDMSEELQKADRDEPKA